MENKATKTQEYIQTIQAVINTLHGATLRADQLDAWQRINACTNELANLMQRLEKDEETAKG